MADETPSSVMFTDLRRFGGIPHRDAAGILLDGSIVVGSKPLSLRIDERTFLSREIVHARPENLFPGMFSDFDASAQAITARLVSARGGGQTGSSEVIAHYRGPARRALCEALSSYGIDAMPYTNATTKVMSLRLERESDRPLLLVMLFLIIGCLADPRAAATTVDAFARTHLHASLDTLISDDLTGQGANAAQTAPTAASRLGIVRLVDGAFRPPIHELSDDPEGTVIGCLPTGAHTIADVDADVSRAHARIWRSGDRWYVADLSSTNGTRVISGADKAVRIVGPASDGAGTPGDTAVPEGTPFQIDNSDILCLGATTRFLVMRLTS